MSLLITGATGQVGGALRSLFPDAFAPTRAQLDLSDEASIRACIRAHRPLWILNPAAYTAVDKAESEPALAHRINADAPRILGEEALRCGAQIIHFSTDYVFDGDKPSPYTEVDPTHPTSIYGQTKLAGEQALAATGAPHLTLRTSWVFAPTGKNFMLTVLRVAADRPQMSIVADQHGAPTAAADLARLAAHILARAPDLRTVGSTFHATSAGETTWHGFATEILRHARLRHPGQPFAELLPIPTSSYPTPARRPANSRLNCDKLAAAFGFRLPSWQDALAEAFAQLPAAQPTA